MGARPAIALAAALVLALPARAGIAPTGLYDQLVGARVPAVRVTAEGRVLHPELARIEELAVEGRAFAAAELGLVGQLSARPIELVVVPDCSALGPALGLELDKRRHSLGVTDGNRCAVRLDGLAEGPEGTLSPGREQTGAVVVHELTHALLTRASMGNVPSWMHEGVAFLVALRFLENYQGNRRDAERLERAILAPLDGLSRAALGRVITRNEVPAGHRSPYRLRSAVGLLTARWIARTRGMPALGELALALGTSLSPDPAHRLDSAVRQALGTTSDALIRDVNESR